MVNYGVRLKINRERYFIHTINKIQKDIFCKCELEIITFPVRTEGNSESNLLLSPNLQTQIFKKVMIMGEKMFNLISAT